MLFDLSALFDVNVKRVIETGWTNKDVLSSFRFRQALVCANITCDGKSVVYKRLQEKEYARVRLGQIQIFYR